MSNSIFFFNGDVGSVGRAKMFYDCLDSNVILLHRPKNQSRLFLFFNLFYHILFSEKLYIINRQSLIIVFLLLPILLIKKNFFRFSIVYDMWEFYTWNEQKSLYSRIGTLLERIIILSSNLVVVCNKQRKRLLIKLFPRKNVIVIENIRIFKSESNYNSFDSLIRYQKDYIYNFIITNGYSSERGDEYLLDLFLNRKNISLTFIGKTTKKDISIFNDYLTKNNVNNIYHHEPIPLSKLSSYISLFDFGIVNYSQSNLNNRYCASGKIFEFLSLGLPVLTSKNLPLLRVLKEFNCGKALNEIDIFISKNSIYKKSILSIDFNTIYNHHIERAKSILNHNTIGTI